MYQEHPRPRSTRAGTHMPASTPRAKDQQRSFMMTKFTRLLRATQVLIESTLPIEVSIPVKAARLAAKVAVDEAIGFVTDKGES